MQRESGYGTDLMAASQPGTPIGTGETSKAANIPAAAHYRADIDGLRSIAVLSVVLFHFDKTWMPSGFLGVDIFFVISGFLITSILVRETGQGKFSIARFYERRIRRIAPALLAFLAATALAATVILLPSDLMGFAKSMLAVLTFVSNFYFWRDGNYFAAASEYKPLLHTWTLAVEEQFYIFFPLLVAFLARKSRSLLPWTIAILSIISLVANAYALRVGAGLPAFYLLPTRAWELGAGALLATRPDWRWGKSLALAAASAGLALVLYAIFAAEQTLPITIPAALPAVAGAVLLIWSGDNGPTPIHRLLALRGPVAIGLISYSLYLWHWPVIVFYRYYTMTDFTYGTATIAFAIMVAFSTLSWRYVEQPFRASRMPVRKVLMISGSGVAVLALFAGALLIGKGLPARMNPAAIRLSEGINTNWRCPLSQAVLFGSRNGCLLSASSMESADAILLGNSHMQMYAPLVADVFEEQGLTAAMIPANGCGPVMGVNIDPKCIRIAETNIRAAAGLKHARIVVIGFSWHAWPQYRDAQGRALADPAGAMIAGLDRTIALLQASGKSVVLIGPIQTPGYDYASVMSRAMAFGRKPGLPHSAPEARFLQDNQRFFEHYRSRADVRFVTPHEALCRDGQCRFAIDGTSMFADNNHISERGLPYLQPVFENGLQGLKSATASQSGK